MWTQMMRSDSITKLKSSRFRRKFRLNIIDRKKYLRCGGDEIQKHAYEVIKQKLLHPTEDTKMTPYKGHPVFTAQHATATCCRRCMSRWHKIPAFRDLSESEMNFAVGLIMRWLRKEMFRNH